MQEEKQFVNSLSGQRCTAEQFLADSQRRAELREELRREPVPSRRMHRLAILLAIATVLSTFWAGVGAWVPDVVLRLALLQESWMPVRRVLLANWSDGLQFSIALMSILVAHELGHYVLTLVYRVPSTPPLFIPFPAFSPFGTLGAIIAMESGTADRRQIFDIGLAGPLAGLLVAVPIIIYGLLHPSPITFAPAEVMDMGQPLLIQGLAAWLVPDQASAYVLVSNKQSSPLLMAGWVGLLVTGLNMMPLGQLDGGHVTFGIFGRNSYYVGVTAFIGAIAFMIFTQVFLFSLMLVLVLFMGLRHPPSSNDARAIGLPRTLIGLASLSLPVLCIPANPIVLLPI